MLRKKRYMKSLDDRARLPYLSGMQAAAPSRRKNSRERPHASAADTVPIAIIDKEGMALRFCDASTFVSACRCLHSKLGIEFYSE